MQLNQIVNVNQINKGEIKYCFQLLNAVETLQKQFGEREVQSKYIVGKLMSEISPQTVYMTLQALVRDDYLMKNEKGKFTFYSLTNKGKDLLNNIRELHQKSVTEPFVKNIANTLKEKYAEEFEDVSDRDLINYLYKKIKKFESATIDEAISNFINLPKEDDKADVA